MNRSTTILTVASVAVGSLVAYAVYFDYKRRNDASFRKQLRKDKKRVAKSQTPSESAQPTSGGVDPTELRNALEKVRKEEVPASPEEKEQYFMAQVGMGEQLCAQGPMFHLPAAMCFYRALRVYPSPVELIVIYEKTVPPPVFQLVMEMTNMDVKDRVEGYYDCFPAKSMNVAVETIEVPDGSGNVMRKKVLVAIKDFEAGDLIYKEEAVATVLDADLQRTGTRCTHCFREVQQDTAVRPDSDRLDSVYCSKDCQLKSQTYSQNLLFTLESPLPAEMAPDVGAPAKEDRDAAQKAFAEYLERTGKAAPLLVARFIARQVCSETAKMIPRGIILPGTEPSLTDGGEYTLYDHVERLRYLEVTPSDEEVKLLRDVLQTALPGLEQFITDERHATFLGKMAYNAYGVSFGSGRDDKPEPTERPEDVEKTRTPYGTSRQIGTGFYVVSSYISHSCAPSARPSFSNGTSELHLVAERAIKKGDEITVAYVDVTQHPEETVAEARRRRRVELARGWRFACPCARCAEENVSGTASDDGHGQKDESRVEPVVTRVEEGPTTLRNDRPTTLTNMLAGDVPPAVQVNSVSAEGIQLADGLILPSACIFLDGKVFLWNVPTTLWAGWGKEHFGIFETAVPKPEILVLGTGKSMALLPPFLRSYVRQLGIQVDVMDTRNACSTYNLLAEEGRRVAAALLPYSPRSWRPQNSP
ncbi:MAS20-domain-containing protein [Leucogyrophana mollusca]|uniref:MAS20-domain-containing protein n=1 Tax=Leucogyrophana mollusca TaxID=85980 RepID=A0ACB8C108_9AGAM|nr:MAS20-domain-containing protein [Leucogyrophana mollusca]